MGFNNNIVLFSIGNEGLFMLVKESVYFISIPSRKILCLTL